MPEHDCCPDCGGGLRQFVEDVPEQLERIRATYKVIHHIRPKCACIGFDRVSKRPLLRRRP
jgi:transposase